MTAKLATVRARIRQMCCLGLPGEVLMASLLPTLRELVPSDSAAFFWVDSRGDMRNLYAERLLPPDAMELYFQRFYEGEAAFRKAFLERAADPEGVIATSADDVMQRTEYYNEILRRLDAHHVLYGIVREQARALGQLSLYRPADAPAFTPKERAELATVMRYVAHGIAGEQARPAASEAFDFQDSEDEAMLVTDRRGRVIHASQKARRLMLLATTSNMIPRRLRAGANERATSVLRALASRLEGVARGDESAPPAIALDTKWGRHVLRAYWLDDDWESPEAVVAVRIQRQEPMILKFVKAMGRLPLSPQQREIALMIAKGLSNHEIAGALGVSNNTVNYHIKQLFVKLDVHDRSAAIHRIASNA